MKKVYLSYDLVADEIIDAFVRKNDDSAIRDFKKAFMQQSQDDTHVQLFTVIVKDNSDFNIDGIPCQQIWDSDEIENQEN